SRYALTLLPVWFYKRECQEKKPRSVKEFIETHHTAKVLVSLWNSGLHWALLPARSAMIRRYGPVPDQKLEHHTEHPGHEGELQYGGTGRHLMCLDLFQHVISENQDTQHGRQLINVQMVVVVDHDFLRRAVVGQEQPNEPNREVQSVVAQDHQYR